MGEVFVSNAKLIVFLHILSAIIWVGGMILMRFSLHQVVSSLDSVETKLKISLNVMKRFFYIVIVSILLLLITSIFMSIGFGLSSSEVSHLAHIKEAVWTIMTINFIVIFFKRERANRLFSENRFKESAVVLKPISAWMIPLNIALGLGALYLGITLRGL
jgi:uncharacterized membrane protein